MHQSIDRWDKYEYKEIPNKMSDSEETEANEFDWSDIFIIIINTADTIMIDLYGNHSSISG